MVNDKIIEIFNEARLSNQIPHELYQKYNVKKGLRNEDGTGVLIGLTRIADVIGYRYVNGNKENCEGDLIYREIPIRKLCKLLNNDRSGFEKTCFLILFGHLPNEIEFNQFQKQLQENYEITNEFLATNILRHPSNNIMNKIQRALLMLYSYDSNADDTSLEHTLLTGISLLAKMPAIISYAYQAKAHFFENKSLIIHQINPEYSIAENILHLLKPDGLFTKEEAHILDLLLIVHADHGSGNNSTFTNIVVSSTDTDLYSCFAASVGSLKGLRHGGANVTCKQMMDQIIDHISVNATDDEIDEIIQLIINKQFFNQKGLLYGFGHAVYTISDPRCEIIKDAAYDLAVQKNAVNHYNFYVRFENRVKNYFKQEKNRDICANVDYYSGFVYHLLNIPEDLYSPLFVCSRTIGWLAHNIEEKLYSNRIIRPAGKFIDLEKESNNEQY